MPAKQFSRLVLSPSLCVRSPSEICAALSSILQRCWLFSMLLAINQAGVRNCLKRLLASCTGAYTVSRPACRSEADVVGTACALKAYMPRGFLVYCIRHLCCIVAVAAIIRLIQFLLPSSDTSIVSVYVRCSWLTWLLCPLQTMPPRRKGEHEEDEGLCSICMDRPLEAQISGCDHQVRLPSDPHPLLSCCM